ncbi:MAG: hypothetical protein JSS66_05700 [Armatimonadetes bacterium]|nr:hypothetical protein [Armatimonadota bacterium]
MLLLTAMLAATSSAITREQRRRPHVPVSESAPTSPEDLERMRELRRQSSERQQGLSRRRSDAKVVGLTGKQARKAAKRATKQRLSTR